MSGWLCFFGLLLLLVLFSHKLNGEKRNIDTGVDIHDNKVPLFITPFNAHRVWSERRRRGWRWW